MLLSFLWILMYIFDNNNSFATSTENEEKQSPTQSSLLEGNNVKDEKAANEKAEEVIINKTLEQFMTPDQFPSLGLENRNSNVTAKRADQIKMKDTPHRELIGTIVSPSNPTLLDFAFAASMLSIFNNSSSKINWTLAKRILRYLSGTINYGVTCEKTNSKMNFCKYMDQLRNKEAKICGFIHNGSWIQDAFEKHERINLFLEIVKTDEFWQVHRWNN